MIACVTTESSDVAEPAREILTHELFVLAIARGGLAH
jgi:hypothetical protein